MQVVNWNRNLTVLSQHSHFHLAVQELLHAQKLGQLYYPDEYVEPPSIDGVIPSLLRRDISRSSRFRISCFGSEDFLESLDGAYSTKDRGLFTERAREAQILSAMLYHRNGLLHRRSCRADLPSHILDIFNKAETVIRGPMNPSVSRITLAYDSRWLEDRYHEYWAEIWCLMHAMARE